MPGDALLIVFSRLIVGAVATFFAILVWSRTRDAAWMLIVIGTIVHYGETVFTTLESFGVVRFQAAEFRGIPVARMIMINLPMIFFIIAFTVMLLRKGLR
jgi:hypothetical protein